MRKQNSSWSLDRFHKEISHYSSVVLVTITFKLLQLITCAMTGISVIIMTTACVLIAVLHLQPVKNHPLSANQRAEIGQLSL